MAKYQQRTALYPLHHSMRRHVIQRTPGRMTAVGIDHNTAATLTGIALEIFTDCTNAGKPLQDAMLAIYLSGIENGMEASKENAREGHDQPGSPGNDEPLRERDCGPALDY